MDKSGQTPGRANSGGQVSAERPSGDGPLAERPPMRGWLVVYLVALVGLALHGLALTIASLSPGHSYWMTEARDAATAERIWDYQLRPYLAE
jgi:hypothetical protein